MRIKPEFYWFMGIVEDRNDPKGMGRNKNPKHQITKRFRIMLVSQ